MPSGATTVTGRIEPPTPSRSGTIADRRAKDTALSVTASTAFMFPDRWSSVPVKSKVISSPSTFTHTQMVAAACCSGRGPVESSTSVKSHSPSGSSARAARIRRSP